MPRAPWSNDSQARIVGLELIAQSSFWRAWLFGEWRIGAGAVAQLAERQLCKL
jgi:hypothetical protein